MQEALARLDLQQWERLLWTLVILVTALTLNLLARRFVSRQISETARRYAIIKGFSYVVGFMVVLVLALIWTPGSTGLAAYLGIVSAGVAIALQDPLVNLVGGVFILLRRPFVVGDRVEISHHRGDVVDIRLFAFSLIEIGNWVDADQSTGRIIHIPNGLLFRHTIANYTQGFNFIWDEIPVTLTFESNWRGAKELLTEIAQRHSAIPAAQAAAQVQSATQSYLIHYEHLTPIVWTTVADHGVTLTLRYLCEPRRRRSTANDIWESILDAFDATGDIEFAYPTTRYFDNRGEGKPGVGGNE
jgi:small-conductance mechanosensitive channel